MSYLEELLPEFRKGAKIRAKGWLKGFYLQIENGAIVDQNKQPYNLNLVDLKCAKWEIYQEPIDWDHIIKNKCLCWFWDDDTDIHFLGTLNKISDLEDQFGDFKYKWNINSKYWKNCRPIRKDEVTFYEDNKE